MKNNSLSKINEQLKVLESESINKLIFGMFCMAIVGVPVSISRAWYTGWQPAYTVHVIGLCILAVLFFFQKKISTKISIWIVGGIAFSVAIAGLLNYGIIGNGMVWVLFCLFFYKFFLGNSETLIVSAVLIVTFFYSLYNFVFSSKKFPGGAEEYIAALSSWGTTFFGSLVFFVLILVIFANHRQIINEMLISLAEQNKIIEKQKEEIEYKANHDALTGLPTLRLAVDRLNMAIYSAKRQDYKVALLFLDLDGFKKINDSFGHDVGDLVLKETSKRILLEIRECDTACRIGGDEFLVILSALNEFEGVKNLCVRLIKTISSEIEFENNVMSVGVSIGVALYPDHADNAIMLRKKADEIMYKVKKSGKNNYLIYEI